jgi:type IV secretion system protein VirD4
MGFAGDLAGDAAKLVMGAAQQIFSILFSLTKSVLGKIFNSFKEDPRKASDRAEFMAKNPPANVQVTSYEKHGVFFGAQASRYVIKPETMDGHVLVCGIPGSGKSSCIAIPTLRNWKGAVFAVDVKGELYEKTKQFRQNSKMFNPQDKNSPYYYDPFIFLNNSENPAQEARAIAQALIPLPPDAREPFWIENAQIILTGAILHYHHMQRSFVDTLKEIQSYTPQTLIKLVAASPSDTAALCVKPFLDMDSRVLSGISAEISRGITVLVTDDKIIQALSWEKTKEIIAPMDLENGRDVYIQIPEHLLKQWKNLLSLMINQFITFFEQRAESPDNRPVLFLLDEFPRLGKIPDITDALATLRSKKITICVIVQSLAQLERIYGYDTRKVIADTCAFKAVLGATDVDTQKYFSALVGTYEKIRRTTTQSSDPYVGAPTGVSTAFSEDNDKSVIKPEEFAYLREIILLYPLQHNFCRVRKLPYYWEG